MTAIWKLQGSLILFWPSGLCISLTQLNCNIIYGCLCFILMIQVGRLENAIGWYHSHPGYGCWLSGIDVGTQMLNQQFQEPFVAIVVRLCRYSYLKFAVWVKIVDIFISSVNWFASCIERMARSVLWIVRKTFHCIATLSVAAWKYYLIVFSSF